MRVDLPVFEALNLDAAEITELSYFENKTEPIVANQITAVADLQAAARSAVFTGTRARIFLDDNFVDVRNDRTTLLASIAAVTTRFAPTIDLTVALGEQTITIRAADVHMVEALAPDPRSETYQGDRSRVFFRDHVLIVRHTASAVIALLDATVASAGFTVVTSTTYTVTATDRYLLVDDDAAGAAVTITLPTTTSTLGRRLTIKKIGTTAAVTVDGNGSETIDEELTVDILFQYDAMQIVSDGTEWWIH